MLYITYDGWWALGREVLFTGMVQRTLHFVLATISLRSFMTFQVGSPDWEAVRTFKYL